MLPHENLNPDQVRMMVRYIYSLKPGQAGANLTRGLAGAVTAPTDEQIREGLLEASFTDAGQGAAAPLSGRATVRLRSRRLEAEFAEEKHGLKVLGNFLGAIDHGHYARFDGLNLSNSGSVTLRVASAGQGGKIELRTGSLEGPVVAEVLVHPTGGWEKFVEKTIPLAPVETRGDLYVVFVNPGKGGLMNLDWVQFNPADQ